MSGEFQSPIPINEPVRSYAPGTPERTALKAKLKEMAAEEIEIPILIGGKEVRSKKVTTNVMPHNHAHSLAKWHWAGTKVKCW